MITPIAIGNSITVTCEITTPDGLLPTAVTLYIVYPDRTPSPVNGVAMTLSTYQPYQNPWYYVYTIIDSDTFVQLGYMWGIVIANEGQLVGQSKLVQLFQLVEE